MRKFILPKKILLSVGNIVDAENLFVEKDLQIGLNEAMTSSFEGKCSIIIDFGAEIRGGIRILTRKYKGDKIRVRLGESVSECNAELGERGSCNDGAIRDDFVSIGSLTDEFIFNTGFRFARIDFPENATAKIKNIYAYCDILSITSNYSYAGTDNRIKEIFERAKRTIDLCAYGEYVWDGIKRDRLVWIGDLYPEMLALTTLYGRVKQVENSLDFIKRQTPLPAFMNNIPTYSLWWIITLCEYYKRTNCYDFLLTQKEYILGLSELVLSHITDTGMPDYKGYFIDWQTTSGIDEDCGGIALNLLAIKSFIYLFDILKVNNSQLLDVKNKLQTLELPTCTKKQIIALKYWAFGKINDDEKQSLITNGVSGITTFLSFIILETIAQTFSIDMAVNVMKQYYGAMIDIGATTFFEDFDIETITDCNTIDKLNVDTKKDYHGDTGAHCFTGFRKSLCHGWSAGIIDFIKKYC